MPLVPFEKLPDTARLWTFASSRPLTDQEASGLLAAADEFLADWAAHGVPLTSAREWRLDRFLFVAVDESAAGASGCSIDALVRIVRDVERQLDVTLTDNAPVWFRRVDGAVDCASREQFQRLADAGRVGPDTLVFDRTIQTTGALRNGRWEVPARASWHDRAFFSKPAAKAR